VSNRLEHEFPAVRWRAVAPCAIDPDLVRVAMARGRRLQGVALRRGVRGAVRSLARALADVLRNGTDAIARRARLRQRRQARRLTLARG
jgi:hypothetical protein